MSILCATDFSEGAHRAATVAALLAVRRRLPLWLVHRASPESLAAAGGPVREGLQALLREEALRLRATHADVHTALLEGPLDRALATFAAEKGARLLVVGAAGTQSPFEGAGGSLDRIAHATSLPLLRVRDAAPFEAWLSGKRPLRVLFAVSRSRGTEAARAWLPELQEAGPVEVVAGHVFYTFDECRRLGLPQPTAFDEVSPELQGALEREVASLASSTPVPVRLRAGLGRMADDVVALAQAEGADLLLLGAHPHGRLGRLTSVAHHALRLAPMAVAAVPVRPGASAVGEAPLPQVRRLLVTTDLSQLGDAALPFALALAPQGSEVHLVTVEPEDATEEALRGSERLLRQRVPRGLGPRSVRVQLHVLKGQDVARTISQAAERLDADLVCMGSHGRGGLGRALLGSVAQQVLAQSRRPVLVMRPSA